MSEHCDHVGNMKASELAGILSALETIAQGEYSDQIMSFTTPDHTETAQRLAEAIGMMMVKIESREYRLEQLIQELEKSHQQLKRNTLHTVIAIANTLGTRDAYTQEHAERVSVYSKRLAKRLDLPAEEVENIRIGARLHDIGKIGFSDAIFAHEDIQVSPEMLEEIRRHPTIGVSILEDLDFLNHILEYVHCHHEKLDGSGYPRGLKGEDIPLGARIISVADCFDAITTDRPYQKGKTFEEAVAILRKLSGPSLDSSIVEAFIEEVEENGMVTSVD